MTGYRKCWAVLAFLTIVPAAQADSFGAIAYDLDTNAYGISWDAGTQNTADSSSMMQCGKNGRNCFVAVRFVNACGAFAVGPRQIWGSGYGASRGVAENAALYYCSQRGNGCTVKAWGCDTTFGSGGSFAPSGPSPSIDVDANRRRAEESRRWGGEEQYQRSCRESSGCGN